MVFYIQMIIIQKTKWQILIDFLRSTDVKTLAIKIAIVVGVFLIASIFWWTVPIATYNWVPIMMVCGLLLVTFIIFENSAKSIVYLFFFANFEEFIREWFYLAYGVFIIVMIVKYFREIKGIERKIYLPMAVVSLIWIIYCLVFSRWHVQEIFALLTANLILLFLLCNLKKDIDFKTVVYFFIAGVFTASVIGGIGVFLEVLPALVQRTDIYNAEFVTRFSALTGNPNRLHFHVIIGLCGIFALDAKGRINKYHFYTFFILLFGLGLMTVSRNFLFVFPVILGAYLLIKLLQEKRISSALMKRIGIMLGCIVIAFAVCGATAFLTIKLTGNKNKIK